MSAHASPFPAAAPAPRIISELQRFYWSVRRELWEHHWLYLAPLSVAGLMLLGFSIAALRLAHSSHAAVFFQSSGSADRMPYDVTAGLILATVTMVTLYYCQEALHGERRDRSILFWKSLPVSDLTTVAAKASVPLVLMPLLGFLITVAAQLLILLLSLGLRASAGAPVAAYWGHVSFLENSGLLLYHLITIHSLGYAPVYAWLLLVSAWARRAPLLWAILPPAGLCILEKLVLNSTYLGSMIHRRLMGRMGSHSASAHGLLSNDGGMQFMLGRYLVEPGLWAGLVVAALLLAAACRVRRARGPV